MSARIETLEQQRVELQGALDGQKSQAERNSMGQFSTPTFLARELLQYASTLLPPADKVRFLDPAIGTGAFYAALRETVPEDRIAEALGFEIDPHYGNPASLLWKNTNLSMRISDFTQASPCQRFNLIICNPPYVRHHHLSGEEKGRLQIRTQQASGMRINGLAGLYCHFLGQSHAWMAEGGVAGWLIPSEFMDVNYGQSVRRYLLDRVTLLHIHRFDPNDVQFPDAIVSSAVVWFRNSPPSIDHEVKFSLGGSLLNPNLARHVPAPALRLEHKWTRFPSENVRKRGGVPILSDYFQIKRGLATGDNSFFILSETDALTKNLPPEILNPILPSPRYLLDDEVKMRIDGTPDIEHRLFLIDTQLAPSEIRERIPALHAYLEEGRMRGLHQRYLCRHRSPWYAQESRPPAPMVCTYIGRSDTKRGRPFRFILNRSRATVANVYLAMYPTPLLARVFERNGDLVEQAWRILNQISPSRLLGEGRVYGGGLHKLEPKELGNVPVPELASLIPLEQRPARQQDLLFEIAS